MNAAKDSLSFTAAISEPQLKLLLTNLGLVSHCSILFFNNEKLIFSASGTSGTLYNTENPLLCDSDLQKLLTQQQPEKHAPFFFLENEHIFYGIIHYPKNVHCITGPFTLKKLDSRQKYAYFSTHHMKDYQNNYIPITTVSQAAALMTLIHHTLTGKYETPDLPMDENILQFMKENSFQKQPAPVSGHLEENSYRQSRAYFDLHTYQLDNAENNIQHHPYKLEQYMMDCIRDGNLEGIKNGLAASSDYTMGTMAHTAKKQAEYASVVGVSLLCRAAISGGVNPYEAYDMNDLYLQKISNASDETAYKKILFDSFYGYLTAVKGARSARGKSVHIEKCKDYILRHLHQNFSLNDLAAFLGLNRTYLSELFKKTENQTLTQYVLSQRVMAAANMLKYSDYSISQIASYFCFQTQSHFGAAFKKYTGMTPAAYRRAHKPQGF